ncbi:MAG TPA: STAS domain-containing protein [Actinomycetota bacterium]|nr:STAS domain-containing protein [Actinomycetota bacterium]
MPELAVTMSVRKEGSDATVIDIKGDVTAACEGVLMDAYTEAGEKTKNLLLNFSGLEYMNSGGIGMLVTLLVRANRNKQRLMACGLNDHYRQIFELTRLDDAISIYDSESDALAAVGAA